MIQSYNKKFTGAVDFSFTLPGPGIFTQAFIRFSAKPTTSENITITAVNTEDSDFDTVIETIDPSGSSLSTSIVYAPSVAIPLRSTETIRIQYTNTDGNTVGITLKGLDSADF